MSKIDARLVLADMVNDVTDRDLPEVLLPDVAMSAFVSYMGISVGTNIFTLNTVERKQEVDHSGYSSAMSCRA